MTTQSCSAARDDLIASTDPEPVAPMGLSQPEKGLMLAVLGDVVACFQKNAFCRTGRERRLFLEAEAYIRKPDRDWLFSFENICDTLGLDPGYLRRGLERWRDSAHRELSSFRELSPFRVRFPQGPGRSLAQRRRARAGGPVEPGQGSYRVM